MKTIIPGQKLVIHTYGWKILEGLKNEDGLTAQAFKRIPNAGQVYRRGVVYDNSEHRGKTYS